ncbi:AAA family ATPase, partial [bacterium]|nr:AAA family ATPase [bacterium]
MFNRSILKQLQVWADNPDRKPLVLRGARQVGKTTTVEMFSKNFDTYIYLNLENIDDKKIFEQNLNIKNLISSIFLYKQKEKKGRCLIFIDEIQYS